MISVDLLIFDLDGTLIDSKEDITDAVNHARAQFDLKPVGVELVVNAIGNGVQSLISKILDSERTDLKDGVLNAFRKRYMENLLDKTRLWPGAKKTLEHFRGKKKALLTNKPKNFTIKILEGLNIRNHFEFVECADLPIEKKPNPVGINRVLNFFGTDPGRAVIVGDSPVDVETGRASGVKTCVISDGYSDTETIAKSKPDLIIKTISELKEHYI